jgi:ParB-like chromosome segregation protein Spo0J
MTVLEDIPLTDIILSGEGWDRYVFNAAPRVEALAESIERVGVNMPLAVVRSEDGCTLVSGYARVVAAWKTGRKSVPCFVIKAGAMTDEQLLELSIEDNRFTRPYHYLDAARILLAFKARCGYDTPRLAAEIAPLIGIPQGERVVEQYLTLNEMAEPLRRFLVEKRLSLAHALLLADLPHEDAMQMAGLFLLMSANANEAKEIAEMLKDLARIKDCRVSEILDSPELAGAGKDAARKALRRMRYPALAAAEDEFAQLVAELRMDTNVSISHSPNFESDSLRVTIAVRSAGELKAVLAKLKAGLDAGVVGKIFAIPGRIPEEGP